MGLDKMNTNKSNGKEIEQESVKGESGVREEKYLAELDTDNIHLTTRPYLDKVKSHTKPYEVDVFGNDIIVLPGVMTPAYDWAGRYMIECLPEDLSGKDVLELGPGTGLVSVAMGQRGAKSVTAADISPQAVENTRLNFEKFNTQNAESLLSDVFEKFEGKTYDLLVFNLPYHNSTPANDLEKGVIDEGYQAMKDFIAGIDAHMTEKGLAIIGFSQSGDVEAFLKEIADNNLQVIKMEEKNNWHEEGFESEDFHYNCQVYWVARAQK